ncbi:MAG: acetolactate synthase small subunit [Planctomycetota bacterium]|nr:acetolactate synthase small subunit [Planctomycetota bacterium]
MRHVISAIVENKPGVLAHIAGLFAGRGFNIDSLAVGETEDPTRSRMTVVARGDDAVLEQVRKQLGKIIDVIKVLDYSDTQLVERDLMLVKVSARPEKRGEIFEIVEVFRGKVVDIGPKHLTLEVSGPEEKIDAFIDLLKPYGIKEVVRTGRIALARGA